MSEQGGSDPSGQIVRAQAPASGVSVPAHLGIGSDLVHSLDYVVVLQVMFNLASGIQSTPMGVWKQLQARGIRSAKNANELVGKNAVYESFARLVEAGYLRRTQLPHPTLPGRKGPVVYEAFDNPAWNPDWQARQAGTDPLERSVEKPQVGTLPGTTDPAFGEAAKAAGRNASRNAGSGNDGSGVPGSVTRSVPAGQDASLVPGIGIASPPTPPGGGGFLLPLPPHRPQECGPVTAGAGVLPGSDRGSRGVLAADAAVAGRLGNSTQVRASAAEGAAEAGVARARGDGRRSPGAVGGRHPEEHRRREGLGEVPAGLGGRSASVRGRTAEGGPGQPVRGQCGRSGRPGGVHGVRPERLGAGRRR